MTNISPTDYTQRRNKILEEMVENTVMYLTNDLTALLEQDRIAKIRRIHKDEILKNLPEAASQIDQLIYEYIIGEDVNLHPKLLNTNQWNTTVGQNQLRAAQRKIIKGDTE